MSPEAPAPLAPARLSRVRALLLALALPFLSLTLVVTTPSTAAAWATPPAPVQIAGALKSPPAKIIMWTPQGRLVMLGIGLGMLAFQTKDSWWPVVEDLWKPDSPSYTVGTTTVYTRGRKSAYYDDCTVTAVTSAPQDFAGTQGVTLENRYSCALNGWPTYRPGYWLRAVSTCRRPNGTNYHASADSGKSGNMGNYQAGYTGTASFSDLHSWSPDALCKTSLSGNAGAVPLHVVIGLATDSESMQYFKLQELDLNNGITAAEHVRTTTVRCRKYDGTFVTINDTLTGHPDKVAMPSCADRVPGSIPWDGSITEGVTGATSTAGTFAIDQALYNQWADCFGPAGLICKTEVYVDGQRCVIGSEVCIIWWRIWRGEPERVECRFGTHVVSIDSCMPLKKAYGTGTKVETTTDVQVVTDPAIDPDTATSPNATPTPSTGANPTTGPNPSTPAAPEPAVETDPNSSSCYGGAWTWNPIDWVFVPVKCALKWAFVPKTALATRVGNIKTGLDTKAPFAWVSGIAAIPAAVPGGACPDWNVKVGDLTKNVVCESSYTDAIRGARPVLLIFMTGLAIWPLVRSTAYAAFPILKPQPGVLR